MLLGSELDIGHAPSQHTLRVMGGKSDVRQSLCEVGPIAPGVFVASVRNNAVVASLAPSLINEVICYSPG